MGNYERFLERDLTPDDYITSGMVYKHVIDTALDLGDALLTRTIFAKRLSTG